MGLASAPLIIIAIVAFLTNIAEWTFLKQDPNHVLPLSRLILSLVGSAWGWPGIICYYVLKNVELMSPSRAAILAAAGFLILAGYELYTYNPL
jgi:tetrahydromethanopterin S-methyltransferase subunit D